MNKGGVLLKGGLQPLHKGAAAVETRCGGPIEALFV
jgi:hypothetical protein